MRAAVRYKAVGRGGKLESTYIFFLKVFKFFSFVTFSSKGYNTKQTSIDKFRSLVNIFVPFVWFIS